MPIEQRPTPRARTRLRRTPGSHLCRLTAVLTAGLFLAAGPAHADRAAGAVLAKKGGAGVPACASCHGPNGEGQAAAAYPRLAGQHSAYLLKQLREFAGGQRVNPQMAPIADALSEQQMRDVADYYASLPGWQAKNDPAPPPQDLTGYHLATRGNWGKGIPACFACHGEGGSGIPPHFPALAGQPAGYTRAQLEAWKTGKRDNDPQGLMKSIAARLSEAEVAAVSTYFEHPTPDRKEK